MTGSLFERHDSENSPIPDCSARAKRKRGAVGFEEGVSSPVSNTGVTITPTPPNYVPPVTEIPLNMLALQGDSVNGSGYRYLTAPNGLDQMDWEMEYRTVIPLETANPSSAGVDWLHIVFNWGSSQASIDDLNSILRDSLGFGVNVECPQGRFNYSRQFILEDGISRFFVGGEYQKGTAMLSFPGSALQFIDYEKLRGLGESILKGWITRVDLCVDFYNGEYSVEDAIKDYESGKFDLSGRTPTHRYIGSLPGRQNLLGSTFYVGKRGNGKTLRVYEKGKKQGIKSGAFTNWTRVELELKGSKPDAKNRRLIPWDVLSRPGSYLAGGYKALEFIHETFDRIKSVAIKTLTTLKKSVSHAKKVFGKSLNAFLHMGMNDKSIISMLKADFGALPVYYKPSLFEDFGLKVAEMRKWCVEVFGCEMDFILIPDMS